MAHNVEVEDKIKKIVTIVFKVLFYIAIAIVFVLLLGYGIMWLWNWLMPDIFGLTTINYWQAVGILILAKVLFGSFGDHSSKKEKRKGKKKCMSRRDRLTKRDFSEWKFYDEFWKEEGENAYKNYVDRKNKEEEQSE